MSKKNIENYIPKAMKVLSNEFKEDIIPSAYNGYISSFGASIIQSGLKPTLALFENKDAATKEDKEYLTKLIFKILKDDINENGSLLSYVISHQDNAEYLKQQIKDISIALKLSIRTFKLKKD